MGAGKLGKWGLAALMISAAPTAFARGFGGGGHGGGGGARPMMARPMMARPMPMAAATGGRPGLQMGGFRTINRGQIVNNGGFPINGGGGGHQAINYGSLRTPTSTQRSINYGIAQPITRSLTTQTNYSAPVSMGRAPGGDAINQLGTNGRTLRTISLAGLTTGAVVGGAHTAAASSNNTLGNAGGAHPGLVGLGVTKDGRPIYGDTTSRGKQQLLIGTPDYDGGHLETLRQAVGGSARGRNGNGSDYGNNGYGSGYGTNGYGTGYGSNGNGSGYGTGYGRGGGDAYSYGGYGFGFNPARAIGRGYGRGEGYGGRERGYRDAGYDHGEYSHDSYRSSECGGFLSCLFSGSSSGGGGGYGGGESYAPTAYTPPLYAPAAPVVATTPALCEVGYHAEPTVGDDGQQTLVCQLDVLPVVVERRRVYRRKVMEQSVILAPAAAPPVELVEKTAYEAQLEQQAANK